MWVKVIGGKMVGCIFRVIIDVFWNVDRIAGREDRGLGVKSIYSCGLVIVRLVGEVDDKRKRWRW